MLKSFKLTSILELRLSNKHKNKIHVSEYEYEVSLPWLSSHDRAEDEILFNHINK